MAVKLRLARHGAKKHPYYRLVAANAEARRDGRFLEHVGSYDPTLSPAGIRLKRDRIAYWLGVGAQPTPTVKRILAKYMDGEDSLARTTTKRKPGVERMPAPTAAPEPKPEPAAQAAPAPAQAPEAAEAPAEAAQEAPAETPAEEGA